MKALFIILQGICLHIAHYFRYIRWVLKGKPYVEYEGGHCGCCGKWVPEKIKLRDYESNGKWADTWTLCKQCANDGIDLSGHTPKRANPPMKLDTVECTNGSRMITLK